MSTPGRLRAAGRALALLAASTAAAASPGTLPDEGTTGLHARALAQVEAGFDQPERALAALQRLAGADDPAPGVPPPAWLVGTLARGLVAAGAGRADEAAQAAARLRQRPVPAGEAAARLIDSANADMAGQAAQALALAEQALQAFAADCAAAPAAPLCEPRLQWRARQAAARLLLDQGQTHRARDQALQAAELARRQGDAGRQALSLSVASRAAEAQGERGPAEHLAMQALQLARSDGQPALLARMALFEALYRGGRGDAAGALRATERGLVHAQRAGSPRLEAMLLTNLSDAHLHAGRPQAALAAVQRALPVVRRHGDRRAERVLMANAGLAKVKLGRYADAKRALEDLLLAFDASGADAAQAQLLREFADALADAGQLPEALRLVHRERRLKAEMSAANRESALAELRSRYDREAQQRRLEQMARDNALIAADLANRATAQRVTAAAVAVGVLALGLLGALLWRMRGVQRELRRNRDLLRGHALRDPLTGLANRRALAEHLAQAQARGEPVADGAWLLVDIDHFKRINDRHGHAAGDAVLVEVAQRLLRAAHPQDLVVRWGGEEFLLHAPRASAAEARARVRGVLDAVASAPVPLATPGAPTALAITASVGFVALPLAPLAPVLSAERAVDLADTALYIAKSQGRNRAVGVAWAQAADAAALQALLGDLEAARCDGRLRLDELRGPAPAEAARAVTEPVLVK